jgi:hypothetical protein
MRSLRETGHRAAFDGRTHDPIVSIAPVDLTCIAIALDARVRPFFERQLADVVHRDPLLPRLRHAAGLLRRVRSAWLGAGVTIQLGIDALEADKQFELCRHGGVIDASAVAIRATLSVATRDELVIPPRAHFAEDARALLEAIENTETPPTDVLDMDLVIGPFSVVDPWIMLEREPRVDQMFCPQCSVPLPPGLDRCPECAAVLSTWREN